MSKSVKVEINALEISENDASIILSCLMWTRLNWDSLTKAMDDSDVNADPILRILMRLQLDELINRFSKAFDNEPAPVVDSEKSQATV